MPGTSLNALHASAFNPHTQPKEGLFVCPFKDEDTRPHSY